MLIIREFFRNIFKFKKINKRFYPVAWIKQESSIQHFLQCYIVVCFNYAYMKIKVFLGPV